MNGEPATTLARRSARDLPAVSPPAEADVRGLLGEAGAGSWVLESRLGDERGLQRTPLQPLPFRIGRASGVSLVLSSVSVSKAHAEIYAEGPALRVRDLGSRNGTFVNRQRVENAPFNEGDVLHVGDHEFRLVRDANPLDDRTVAITAPLSRHFLTGARAVRQMIDEGAITTLFQPILTLPSQHVCAYEALGRGLFPGLPAGPVELFELAGQLGPETQAELSRLFRRSAVAAVRERPDPPLLFLNTHPAELERPGLLESLEELRAFAPGVDLVLEIHESALAHTDFISLLRSRLSEINVGLAYDDFGAGQARLFELAEAPPHYLKFDRRFVSGIDHAPASRQRLVASLVAAARELLVKTIAEGIETAAEAEACVRAGFSHAQGYHLGEPAGVERVS